jgi:hypothetical protein
MTNNTTFPGTLTCPTSSVSNAMTMGTTKTYVVTMTNASGANKYYIDGYLQASLVLHQGQTYIFDLSSSTLSGHPFEFSTTNNGSHGGGSAYSTGITTTGTYADDQTRTFVVSTSTPTTLYYYCTQHSGMGGSVTISPKAELIVSGGAEFIGTGTIKLPSGTTSERPATGINGMIRYNTTTGFIETYTAEGWGSIAPPPVITGISPTSVAGADTATQVFTVTGTGFDTGITIKLVGANGTEYSVFNATRVSGQSATFKMGASGASGGYDVAQRPFNVKVIGGDTASAVTSTSTDSIALTAPTITGVSPTTFASSAVGSQTITVTGTNFASSMASGNNIQVLGADGSTLYNVDSAAVASATSITFKLAATGASLTTGQLDNRPYKVRVTDAVGITATSTATIGFNGIAWSSPAANATLTYDNGVSSSQNLVATDDLGGTDVTFSITSGSVAGLSLGSATASPATFSGSGTTDGTTNVTFRVTDNESGTTADRTFSVVVSSALFAFSPNPFTFDTSAYGVNDQYSRNGASLQSGPHHASRGYKPYTASWTQNTAYYNEAGASGYQLWTVPQTGSYTIKAYGARGGRSGAGSTGNHSGQEISGGNGAWSQGTFTFTGGVKLVIIAGIRGMDASESTAQSQYLIYNAGGGGGGSFVCSQDLSTLYVAAGGGGGACSWYGQGTGPTAGGTSNSTQTSAGGAYGGDYGAGGGAGFSADGAVEANGSSIYAPGAQYYTAPGSNGKNVTQNSAIGGIYGSSSQNAYLVVGGFGGGGGAGTHAGGGGGGWQGGDTGSYGQAYYAKGGSSKNAGTSVTFGTHSANSGYVVITKN